MKGNDCGGLLLHPLHQTYEALGPVLSSFILPPCLPSTYLLRPWTVDFLVFQLQLVTLFLRCMMLSETFAVRGAPPVCSLTSIWRRRWCRWSPAAEPSGWSRLSVWSLLKTEVAKSIHFLYFSKSMDNYVKKNSCNQMLCYFLYFNFSLYWKRTKQWAQSWGTKIISL